MESLPIDKIKNAQSPTLILSRVNLNYNEQSKIHLYYNNDISRVMTKIQVERLVESSRQLKIM